MTEKSANDVLCKLLEEHGIAWKKRRGYIRWSKQTEYGVTHYQAWPCFDETITLTVRDKYGLTPEQAIAATLGAQTAGVAEKIEELRFASLNFPPNIRRKVNIAINGIEQAIADELNAELGSGTCELVETDSYSDANEVIHVLECSECGKTCEHVNGSYPRCPHCGAKAVR